MAPLPHRDFALVVITLDKAQIDNNPKPFLDNLNKLNKKQSKKTIMADKPKTEIKVERTKARLTGLLLISYILLGYSGQTVAQNIPNMIKLDKTGVYIDKTVVSIRGWHEYVWYMYKTYGADSEQFHSAKCDSAVFRNHYNHVFLYPYTQGIGKMEKYGFSSGDINFMNEEYDKHPMVGLSYEQCVAFCNWRTEMYNKVHKKKLQFRMPTSEELRKASGLRRVKMSDNGNGEIASDATASELGTFRCVATILSE